MIELKVGSLVNKQWKSRVMFWALKVNDSVKISFWTSHLLIGAGHNQEAKEYICNRIQLHILQR